MKTNQAATDQVVQDLTYEISGGGSIKMGVIRLKTIRDLEAEYDRLSKIPNGFGELSPENIFVVLQPFFSIFLAANLKAYSDKEK